MGKAIVIDGLQVTNPLCIVTFSGTPVENALRAYLAANTSINATEEEVLGNFVEGLIDAGLWNKMKYFYPLIGSGVSDMVLDVVNPSTEDIMSNAGTTGWSVLSRCLISNNRPLAYAEIGSRAKELDPTKIGFIMAGNFPADNNEGGQLFQFRTTNNLGLEIVTGTSAYRYPRLVCNGTNVNLEENTSSYLNRIVFGNVNNGTGSIYSETVLKASDTVDLSGYDIANAQTYGVLTNKRESNYQYNFFAITEGMTAADWAVFYPLLNTYLVSLGRRSASE